MPLDRNAEKQEVPVDPKTGKPYINTLAAVAMPAIRQAFAGAAKTIGISITSGGMGKKELSINATANKKYIALRRDAKLSI